eukprot:2107588-Rhodomonas_salina.3
MPLSSYASAVQCSVLTESVLLPGPDRHALPSNRSQGHAAKSNTRNPTREIPEIKHEKTHSLRAFCSRNALCRCRGECDPRSKRVQRSSNAR